MPAAYDLAWQGTCLRFTLRGMWDAATMAQWDRDYRAAVARAPRTGWTVIGDLTEHPPQTPEIQAGHEALMNLSRERGVVAAALVVPKAVQAMQMKRLAAAAKSDDFIRFVTSVAEGEKVLREALAIGA